MLITIQVDPFLSMPKVKANELQLVEDPTVKATSYLSTVARMGKDHASPPILPPSSTTMTARCQRNSYDRSSLHRSARPARCNVLKDLGVVENYGKLDEDVFRDYADHLQELLMS